MKNTLVKNTLILIITSLIVRLLSLFNRIVLTRLLGNEGISLYVISLPSIMLFMSIAGFSLNLVLSKIVSENQVTKKYSDKAILKNAILIGFVTSLITALILIIVIKPLVYVGLKQEKTFYPILSCIIFLPLVALNNIIRGYYNGKNQINISAYANLIEQVSRILVGTLFLYIFLPYGLIISVTMAIIAMGIGEFISLIYSLVILKRKKVDVISKINDISPKKDIIRIGLPTTLSRLVGNFSLFLEPIIYTLALSILAFSSDDILYKYSAVTAYAIPLITLCSFISQSIATAVIPNISKANASNNTNEINYYIKKSCILSIIPGILVSILITVYGYEYMSLVYNTDIGANYVTSLGALFIVYYIHSPLMAIMQALGRQKFLFKFNIIISIIKLILIFGLSFINFISFNSLILATLLVTIISTMYIFFYLKNTYKFKFFFNENFNFILLTVLTILSLIILKAGIKNYLLNSFILSILFIIYAKILKITSFRNK
ncbi:MAG: oligosaccharide flippase family protein [Bacilli bacterium]